MGLLPIVGPQRSRDKGIPGALAAETKKPGPPLGETPGFWRMLLTEVPESDARVLRTCDAGRGRRRWESSRF
jgi:hypothetical protein